MAAQGDCCPLHLLPPTQHPESGNEPLGHYPSWITVCDPSRETTVVGGEERLIVSYMSLSEANILSHPSKLL